MPDDQNTTQNPISGENSIPPSPQEPIPDASIPSTSSTPLDSTPEVPEAPGEGFSDESNNTPLDTNEPLDEPETETEFKPQNQNPVREILAKAQEAIQNKKRKKLDRILTLFATKSEITNDEVEKLLHVSDATATRYLSILEDEGKIIQNGRTGKSVSYSKI